MKKLLEINNLCTSFFTHAGEVKAVRGVNLFINNGETLGIVGESGCGKSVTMMSLMRLLPESGKITNGNIVFNGNDLSEISDKEIEKIRGNEIAMIFQDPMTSLNPVFNIGTQLTEHLIKHKKISKSDAMKRAVDMLKLVGIPNPEQRLKQYPHEFSGGMRQRAMIAMALITDPKLLIADEPTTALDVTIQAQILELMKDIKKKLGTSIILITHDLGVVADMCDRINVMYGGSVIEEGTSEEIFYEYKHPYTYGLLNSVPNPKKISKERLKPIDGQPPDLLKPPSGCPFAARCEYAMRICLNNMPKYYEVSKGHRVACHLLNENAPATDFKGGNK